jgi:lipoate-protein ligase A
MVSKALKVKPEKFQSKSVKSVRARVGNIKEFLPRPMGIEEFTAALTQKLTQDVQAEALALSAPDLKAIQELRDSKYVTWEWNYGRSPAFNFKNIQKFEGGFLEVFLDVADGSIKACKFFGDFMALRPVAEVAEKLPGIKYSRENVAEILEKLPLSEYFGTISLHEILDCLFNN